MKPTPYETLMAALKANDKTPAGTDQPENRHADFMARELDKIIPPQPKASIQGAKQ